jgi:two-component system KDP operon response regulator KdpE
MGLSEVMSAPITLIIDTDENRQSAVPALRDAGLQVIEAVESGEGVRYILDDSTHIIIVGEEMPPIDGVELLPLLRSLTESPIIVLGSGGEMAMVRALFQGADFYLSRPVTVSELIARIRALLRR